MMERYPTIRPVLVLFVLMTVIFGLKAENAFAQDTKDIVAQAQQIANPEAPFKIELWTEDKKDSYNPGDSISFMFKTDRDCYVTLIDIGTSGKVTKIFPNEWHSSNQVKAGQVYRIPPVDSSFRFKVDPPGGTEFVKAIASLDPLTCVSKAAVIKGDKFQVFEKPAPLMKDISTELSKSDKQRWTEAQLSFQIAAAPATATAEKPFGIKLSTDKTEYKIGEPIVFTFQSDRPCYLSLIDIGSSGKVKLIFPNQYHESNLINANQAYKIPPEGQEAKFSYKVAGPPGSNTIKAVATLDPCQMISATVSKTEVYPVIGTKEVILKDIEVCAGKAKPGHFAEANLTIEIK